MTTLKTMHVEEESSFSTSSSSSSSSNGDYHSPTSHFLSTSFSSSSTSHLPTTDVLPVLPQIVSHKRRAGRKKFRETRHPVYRGVRERNGGRWVCEVREPRKTTRIWLGTYQTPEMAARAHDVAAIALRGKSAPLNFPDSASILPRAASNSGDDIRAAAARAAGMFRTPSPTQTRRKHEQPQQLNKTHVELPQRFTTQTPLLPPPSSIDVTAPTGVFVDEEALFNMPGLLQNMAQGLLLTPPPMQPEYDWNDDDCHMDITLWSDN